MAPSQRTTRRPAARSPAKGVATHLPSRRTRTLTARGIEQGKAHRQPVSTTVAVRRERRRRHRDAPERPRNRDREGLRDGRLHSHRVDAKAVLPVRQTVRSERQRVRPGGLLVRPTHRLDILPAGVDRGHRHRRRSGRRVSDRRSVCDSVAVRADRPGIDGCTRQRELRRNAWRQPE